MSDHFEKSKFQLWKINTAIALIWILVIVAASIFVMTKQGVDISSGSQTSLSYKMGKMFGASFFPFLFSYFIGWVFYRLFRRSLRAGNIAFLVTMLCYIILLTVSFVSGIGLAMKDKEAQQAILARVEATRSKLRQQNASDEGINTTDTLQAINELAATADQFKDEKGLTGKMTRVLGRAARDSKSVMEKNLKIIESIQTLGDMTNIKTKEDIEARIKLYGELRDSSKAMITYYDEIPTRLKTYLDEEKVPASEQAGFMKGMNESRGSTEEHTAYQNTIIKFSEDSAALYQYLLDHWGKWKFQGDEILFDAEIEDGANTEYNKLLEEQEASLDAMVKSEEDWNSKVLKK